MKQVLMILSLFCLASCTIVDSYLLTHYDPNEYYQMNTIRFKANQYKVLCDDPVKGHAAAVEISELTQQFEFYSQHIPKNDDGYKIAKNINAMAQGLKSQYDTNAKVSPVFCTFKFEGIERSAELAQKTLGARPR